MGTTYEVWLAMRDGTWQRLLGGDSGEDGEFYSTFKLAQAGAKSKLDEGIAPNEDVKEVVVIERRVVLKLNGPAI